MRSGDTNTGVQECGIDEGGVVEHPARRRVFMFAYPRGPIVRRKVCGVFFAVGPDERGDVVNAVAGGENPNRVAG